MYELDWLTMTSRRGKLSLTWQWLQQTITVSELIELRYRRILCVPWVSKPDWSNHSTYCTPMLCCVRAPTTLEWFSWEAAGLGVWLSASNPTTGGWLVVGCQKPLLTFLSLLLQYDDVDAFHADCIAMTSRWGCWSVKCRRMLFSAASHSLSDACSVTSGNYVLSTLNRLAKRTSMLRNLGRQ